jgi:hypothetical protein
MPRLKSADAVTLSPARFLHFETHPSRSLCSVTAIWETYDMPSLIHCIYASAAARTLEMPELAVLRRFQKDHLRSGRNGSQH